MLWSVKDYGVPNTFWHVFLLSTHLRSPTTFSYNAHNSNIHVKWHSTIFPRRCRYTNTRCMRGPIVDISNSTNIVAVGSEQEPFHVINNRASHGNWHLKFQNQRWDAIKGQHEDSCSLYTTTMTLPTMLSIQLRMGVYMFFQANRRIQSYYVSFWHPI